MLLRCLGWRKRKREGHTLVYADAFVETDPERTGATVHRRGVSFAGFVAHTGEKRLPVRVVFVEMVGDKGYSRGKEKGCMGHLDEDLKEFSIKSEGRRLAAQKTSEWC